MAMAGVENARENMELAIGNPIEISDAIVTLNNVTLAYSTAITDY